MARPIDQTYFDDSVEYANDEPIGGTGYEPALERPGFIYKGSVAGEAPAREAWNAGWQEGQPDTLDHRGNAYARQAALTYDAIKAQADAQAQIEASYRDAKTAGDIRATQAAEEYQRRLQTRRDIAAGVPQGLAIAQNWTGRGGNMSSAINALRDRTPHLQDFGEGVGKAIVTGTGQVRFPPVQIQTPTGPVQGVPVIDPNTGEPTPNKFIVPGQHGGMHVIDTTPAGNPADKLRISGEIANADTRLPPTRYSGPLSTVQERFGTNLPPALRGKAPASSVKEVIRVTKDGRKAIFDAQTKRFIRYADQ